jgi:hypothetical protein
MNYTHTCKCGAKYESDDPDPYRCPACVEASKQAAAEIDAKRAADGPVGRQPSALDIYNSVSDGRGFARASDIL